jgi:hypothetical protein
MSIRAMLVTIIGALLFFTINVVFGNAIIGFSVLNTVRLFLLSTVRSRAIAV